MRHKESTIDDRLVALIGTTQVVSMSKAGIFTKFLSFRLFKLKIRAPVNTSRHDSRTSTTTSIMNDFSPPKCS